MNKKNLFSVIFITLFVLFSINFFDYRPFMDNLVFYIRFVFLSIIVLFSLPYVFKFKGLIPVGVSLISFSILFSVFMAYFSWEQDFLSGYKATVQYLIWFVFFMLLKEKPSIVIIERIILILGFLYIVLYFFQFVEYKNVIFGYKEEVVLERGTRRFILPGLGLLVLSYFISLRNISIGVNSRIISIIFVILSLTVFYLQATRQNIVAIFALSIIYLTRKQKIPGKIFTYVFSIAFLVVLFTLENAISMSLIEAQKDTVALQQDYIRFLTANYFLNDFSPNLLSRVFGNGMPYGSTSYGFFNKNLTDNQIYFADVGLIAVYAYYGLIAIAGYVLIWYSSFKLRISNERIYVKYYLWFLLFTSLTSDYTYHYYFIASTVISLYILYVSTLKKKQKPLRLMVN